MGRGGRERDQTERQRQRKKREKKKERGREGKGEREVKRDVSANGSVWTWFRPAKCTVGGITTHTACLTVIGNYY